MSSINNVLAGWFNDEGTTQYRHIDVHLTGEGLRDIATAYVTAAQNHYRNSKVLEQLSVDKLTLFFHSMLVYRVRLANKRDYPDKSGPTARYDPRGLSVPALVGGLLTKVGVVMDHEFGFFLYPVIDPDMDVMSAEECTEMVRLIWNLNEVFHPVKFPRPDPQGKKESGNVENGLTSGDVRFMSKALIGNYIKSYRPKDHLESLFAAAIFGATLVEEAQKVHYYRSLGDPQAFLVTIPHVVRDYRSAKDDRNGKDELEPIADKD